MLSMHFSTSLPQASYSIHPWISPFGPACGGSKVVPATFVAALPKSGTYDGA